jgi:hypothetical protein
MTSHMRSTFYFICLLMISGTAAAQTVDVIQRSAFATPGPQKDFHYLEPNFDSVGIRFVATLKVTGTGKQSDIDVLYAKVKEKANELGANAFRLNSYDKSDITKTSVLQLDTYYGPDSALGINFEQHEKNVVFIFGDADKSNKSYTFKVDNEKKEIKGGTYYKQVIKEGQELKINKGGMIGATVWTKWRKDRPATFLTLTGFGLGGGPMPPGMTGVAINTGRINYVNGNLGHLLTQILKQQE